MKFKLFGFTLSLLVISVCFFLLLGKELSIENSALATVVTINASDNHSSSLSIEVTNHFDQAIDIRNLTVAFDSPEPVNRFWGDFPFIGYPGAIEVQSWPLRSNQYRVYATLRFAEINGDRTRLSPGSGFTLDFELPRMAGKSLITNVSVIPARFSEATDTPACKQQCIVG